MNTALSHCDELAARALTVCQQAVSVAWDAGQRDGWWGGITWGLVIAVAVVGFTWWWSRRRNA